MKAIAIKKTIAALTIITAAFTAPAADTAVPTKPNIIYLICDELSYFGPSFMGSTARVQLPQLAAVKIRLAGQPVSSNESELRPGTWSLRIAE